MAELNPLDDAGDDFTLPVLIFLKLPFALGVADLLHDDLLGGLGSNPAKFNRRQRVDDEIPKLGLGIALLGFPDGRLGEVILDLLDHFNHAPQPGVTRHRVDLGPDVILGPVTGAGSLLHSLLHRLDHNRAVNGFLPGDGIGDGNQFGLVGGNHSG